MLIHYATNLKILFIDMTQEEKELLLQDLCARLPYGVKATTTSNGWRDVYIVSGCNDNRIYLDCPVYDEGDDEWLIESVKPYLRPMSSMTEEEREEYRKLGGVMSYNPEHDTWAMCAFTPEAYDWLNKKMFDYRGLIPMGLALEAPKDMYNN